MTERPSAQPAAKPKPSPRADVAKLMVLVGATGLVYAGALGPILGAIHGIEAADAAHSRLVRRVLSLERQNRRTQAELRRAEAQLSADVGREGRLRSELSALTAQAPAASPATPSFTPVQLPAVHTTTGASGVP